MSVLDLAKERCNVELDFSGDLCLVTFLNPYSYIVVRKAHGLLEKFSAIYIDGAMLVTALRAIGVRVFRRSFDMTSLAPLVFSRCADEGLTVAFVGGEPGVALAASDYFQQLCSSRLKVSLVHSGFFDESDSRDFLIQELVRLSPRVVVVGMGTPLQEKFLVDLVAAGWCGLGFTCGGFFHQTASKGGEYYPKWINRLGLRWLYRMIDEPVLIRRYFIEYPRFCFLFALDSFRGGE